MSRPAPPEEPAARTRTFEGLGAAILKAAAGSAEAVGLLVAICLLVAVILSQVIGVFGLSSWAEGGLLTAALSFRADAVATVRGAPILPPSAAAVSFEWRFVPMLLTMGFLWFEARAGRRAAEERVGRPSWLTVVGAVAGAAIPAAILAALIAIPVSLSFPSLGLRIRVDPASAAASAAALAAAGAAVGAFLRAERGRLPAAALRGGLVAYGWAMFLLVLGVFALAALEPGATGAYVRSLQGLGSGGGILFGEHILAMPVQSALLLAPASGSCLHLLDRSQIDLCPWSLAPVGPGPVPYLSGPVALSPWLWLLSVSPPVAALLGGRAGGRVVPRARIVAGAASGPVFAALAVLGAWFAAPWVAEPAPLFPGSIVRADLPTLALATVAWGCAGGTVGGWLERRIAARRL